MDNYLFIFHFFCSIIIIKFDYCFEFDENRYPDYSNFQCPIITFDLTNILDF